MTVSAVQLALDLFHFPSRVRQLRREPLPKDTVLLLKIAAGDYEALRLAMQESERPAEIIRTAATFFIEQILISEPHDKYRVLGLSPNASSLDLKRNFALLMRWLHPDGQSKDGENPFVSRVTNAWNNVKTPERRAAYDLEYARTKRTQETDKIFRQRNLPLKFSARKKIRHKSQKTWLLNCLSALGLKI